MGMNGSPVVGDTLGDKSWGSWARSRMPPGGRKERPQAGDNRAGNISLIALSD